MQKVGCNSAAESVQVNRVVADYGSTGTAWHETFQSSILVL